MFIYGDNHCSVDANEAGAFDIAWQQNILHLRLLGTQSALCPGKQVKGVPSLLGAGWNTLLTKRR